MESQNENSLEVGERIVGSTEDGFSWCWYYERFTAKKDKGKI